MNENKLWRILVPTVRNDGRPFRLRYHRVWDEKVRNVSGGLTICSPVVGQWVNDDDVLYKERMIPVEISCTNDQMFKIAEMTREYYEQEAVMFYLISDKAYIINEAGVSFPYRDL